MKEKRPRIRKPEVSSRQINKKVLVLDQKNRIGVLERRRKHVEEAIKEDMRKLRQREIEISPSGKVYIWSDKKDIFMGQGILW